MPPSHSGDTLESAAAYVSAGSGPSRSVSKYETEAVAERAERYQIEHQFLMEWARQNNKLGAELPPDQKGGAEHSVFFDEASQRWIKATRPPGFGEVKILHDGKVVPSLATPSEYLERLILSNDIFHDDIRIEKIVPTHDGLAIVTSQSNIVGEPATSDQIESAMRQLGFEKVADESFYSASRKILVTDLGSRNAAFSMGHVLPFDAMVQPSTPEFIFSLKLSG